MLVGALQLVSCHDTDEVEWYIPADPTTGGRYLHRNACDIEQELNGSLFCRVRHLLHESRRAFCYTSTWALRVSKRAYATLNEYASLVALVWHHTVCLPMQNTNSEDFENPAAAPVQTLLREVCL